MSISPIEDQSAGRGKGARSLRDVVNAIDNKSDLKNYISSHSSKVPAKPADIKYEQHRVSRTGDTLLHLKLIDAVPTSTRAPDPGPNPPSAGNTKHIFIQTRPSTTTRWANATTYFREKPKPQFTRAATCPSDT